MEYQKTPITSSNRTSNRQIHSLIPFSCAITFSRSAALYYIRAEAGESVHLDSDWRQKSEMWGWDWRSEPHRTEHKFFSFFPSYLLLCGLFFLQPRSSTCNQRTSTTDPIHTSEEKSMNQGGRGDTHTLRSSLLLLYSFDWLTWRLLGCCSWLAMPRLVMTTTLMICCCLRFVTIVCWMCKLMMVVGPKKRL